MDYYKEVFKTLAAKQPSESVKTLLESFKQRRLCEDISVAAYEASTGSKSILDVLSMARELEEPQIKDYTFVTDDIEEILDSTTRTPGLRWRLNTLNRMLGSLRKGDFGFIVARPEVGKTAFCCSEVTHMATQLKPEDGPILWFNNEEEGKKVKKRLYQAALGWTSDELDRNSKKAYEAYLHVTGGKILLYDDATTNRGTVEAIAEKYKPSLIVTDQLDKVYGFKADREDLRMGAIYIWAREIAKRYCPFIGVSQADGTAEGAEYLTMVQVANSKTSKAAEADWILGIGRSTSAGAEYIRGLSVLKNKLSGDQDSEEALRHGKAQVLIDPERMRYRDIGQWGK